MGSRRDEQIDIAALMRDADRVGAKVPIARKAI